MLRQPGRCLAERADGARFEREGCEKRVGRAAHLTHRPDPLPQGVVIPVRQLRALRRREQLQSAAFARPEIAPDPSFGAIALSREKLDPGRLYL